MIAKLYNIDIRGITRHINNILKDGELDEKVVCANFAYTTKHGAIENKININYEIDSYGLNRAISYN